MTERQSGTSGSITSLWVRAYLPHFLWSLGQGAMIAVLALAAKDVGATTAVAAVVVAMTSLGTVAFDLPSGRVVSRFGEIRSAWVALALTVVGLVGAIVAQEPLLLGCSVFLIGAGWGMWGVRITTQVSRVAAVTVRGRALALVGGVGRAGSVLGPLLLVAIFGHHSPRGSFVLFLVATVAGSLVLIWGRDRHDVLAQQGRLPHIRPITVVTEHRREFLTAGAATFGICMLRGSRQALVPLWGAHIGLSLGQIALIFSVSSLLDLIFFYPAGMISDRYGRKLVAVPCLLILSLGHALLPLAHGFGALFAVALVLGFGNSLGSGIVKTLGADRAPDIGRASFLAVWQLVADAGNATGPLISAAVVAATTLAFAGPVVGLLGFGAAYVVARYMEDLSVRAPRRVAPTPRGEPAPEIP